MSSHELRQQYRDILIEQVRDGRYPSPTMMERYERSIRDVETAEEYIGFLLEIVGRDRYPSPQMLDHIARLIDRVAANEELAEDSSGR